MRNDRAISAVPQRPRRRAAGPGRPGGRAFPAGSGAATEGGGPGSIRLQVSTAEPGYRLARCFGTSVT